MEGIERVWRRLPDRQHGLVSYRQLLSAGLSRRQIEGRLQAGIIEAVHRGVYRVVGSHRTVEQAVLAACMASGGVASHRSAAALWELRGCESVIVEVTVVGRRRPALSGVVGRSSEQLEDVDICERRSIPVTSPARTLLDLGAVAPPAQVAAALEDALHRRLVTRAWLERTLERAGRRGRAGTAVMRALLAERDPTLAAMESVLEDDLVRLLRRAGLPEPVRQHWISAPKRPAVRVDLAYPDLRLAIEAQSVAWHSGQADLQRDCDKQNLLAGLGWRLLDSRGPMCTGDRPWSSKPWCRQPVP